LKYHANPDLQREYVGMPWSIKDASDSVRPNAQQMREKYEVTENSRPLYKAYNGYENPKQTYEERMAQYSGPEPATLHNSMRSNGFT